MKAGKASELVARLQALIAEHGDLPVVISDADTNWNLAVSVAAWPSAEAAHWRSMDLPRTWTDQRAIVLWGSYGDVVDE